MPDNSLATCWGWEPTYYDVQHMWRERVSMQNTFLMMMPFLNLSVALMLRVRANLLQSRDAARLRSESYSNGQLSDASSSSSVHGCKVFSGAPSNILTHPAKVCSFNIAMRSSSLFKRRHLLTSFHDGFVGLFFLLLWFAKFLFSMLESLKKISPTLINYT